jgi:hypothetical protein
LQYNGEPQTILKRKLEERCPQISTKTFGTIYGSNKRIANLKYDKWMVTVDHTVAGVGSENIQRRLPHHYIKSSEWDSYGIELVSPVLSTGLPYYKRDIQQLVNATVGTSRDKYGAFITNQCGFHVHVEAPKNLEVLKELAILLLIYEEEIGRLHAPVRRPGHASAAGQLESNRLYFLDVNVDSPNRVGGDFSTRALIEENGSIRKIRNRISIIQKKKSLSQKMCWPSTIESPHGDRNRLVNFTYLVRGDGFAETIEFRQARGTLDPEEIFHWIDFCIGLVRLAEYYYQNPNDFPVTDFQELHSGEGTSDNQVGVFRLMTDMGLSQEAIRFWDEKVKRYEAYQDGDEDDTTDYELPPLDDNPEDDDSVVSHSVGGWDNIGAYDDDQAENHDADSKNTSVASPYTSREDDLSTTPVQEVSYREASRSKEAEMAGIDIMHIDSSLMVRETRYHSNTAAHLERLRQQVQRVRKRKTQSAFKNIALRKLHKHLLASSPAYSAKKVPFSPPQRENVVARPSRRINQMNWHQLRSSRTNLMPSTLPGAIRGLPHVAKSII